ncbi:MAG: patatin-like phospholipase family protein [Acidimicrobiia bacterium]
MASKTRIGIALGAGAATGIAWDIGVLKALRDEIGFELANCAAIYGTSAGSWVGARVLGGRSLDDLTDEQLGNRPQAAPPSTSSASGDGAAARAQRGGGTMVAIGLWRDTKEMDQARLKEIGLAALSDNPVLAEDAWMSLCGTGLPSSEWPEQNFGICSVCCETGERVSWKKESGVELLRAMAASCSIPSVFPSIEIGGLHYMDGGVWSGGNCDYLLADEVDVPIFVGSMLGNTPIGRIASNALDSERKQFADRGQELFTITPGPDFWGEGSSMDPNGRGAALEAGLAAGKEAAGRLNSLL